MKSISEATLRPWVEEVLRAWGYAPDAAAYIADTMLDANLRGVDSHGVIRLGPYHRRIAAGLVEPNAKPQVARQGAIVTVDGNGAPGQLAARAAVTELIAASDELGSAIALVRGSAHFGTAGYYARALADAGKVAIIASNSEPAVVPFGGKSAFLGTNPLAMAAPTSGAPVCLDMATSTSAFGQVIQAEAEGRDIPDTWGVDSQGEPTTDPSQVVSLLPAAGPKGYGIGFFIDVIAGILAGAAAGLEIGNMYRDFDRPQNIGHFMIAFDVSSFQPMADFIARMDAFVAQAHSAAPAPGFDSVLVPGEPQERVRAERLAQGIPLPDATIAELQELGAEQQVPFPALPEQGEPQ